jgi:hypothetical protein
VKLLPTSLFFQAGKVPWPIPFATTSSTILQQFRHTNVAMSWLLSSVLAVLGQPVCLSHSILSLSHAKHLCHLSTALWPKASSPYTCLITWNILLVDLPHFWPNFMFSSYSTCDILNFCHSQTFFLNTLHACNCLLGQDKTRYSIISQLHASLQSITAPVCSQSMKLLTALCTTQKQNRSWQKCAYMVIKPAIVSSLLCILRF